MAAVVIKAGNLTVERVRHIRKRKMPTWCVLVSEGRGLLRLRLYDSEAETLSGIRPLEELEVRADLVQRSRPGVVPPGFSVKTKRPFQEKLTHFEAASAQECDAWMAALTAGGKRGVLGNRTSQPEVKVPSPPPAGPSQSSTSKPSSPNLERVDVCDPKKLFSPGSVAPGLKEVMNEMPRLPVVDRPMRQFFNIMHAATNKTNPSEQTALTQSVAARNHTVFMELFSRFDKVGLEAMLHPEVKVVAWVTDVSISGRGDVVDMLYSAARTWTLLDMGEVEVEHTEEEVAFTKCSLSLEHQVFHIEVPVEQKIGWMHGLVYELSLRMPKTGHVSEKVARFFKLKSEFENRVVELLQEPLPFDLVEDEREEARMLSKFEMSKVLGAGSFGTVKLATNKEDGALRAIKAISKELAYKEDVEREINLMRAAQAALGDDPHIVQLFETYEGEEAYFLVMELVTGGEVYDRIVKLGHFSEKLARDVFTQLLTALCRLHEAGVMHRDLKPENLLFANQDYKLVKIADFGLGGFFKDPFTLQECCGTPTYMAPELILCGETCTHDDYGMPMRVVRTYGPAVDIWSSGVILYQMLSGELPFLCEWKELPADDPSGESGHWDLDGLYESILTLDFAFPPAQWNLVSDEAVDIICRMLVLNPSKRLTARAALDHPWVQKVSEEEDETAQPLPGVVDGLSKHQAMAKSMKLPDAKASVAAKQRVKDMVSTMGWGRFHESGKGKGNANADAPPSAMP